MSLKTHKTAVVLIPPEELFEPIQVLRREHDRHFERWMPHITLVYPFRPRDEFDMVRPALRDACKSIAPFELRLARFRNFRHGKGSFTLWLAPEPTDAVVRLQATLESVLPDCNDASRHAAGFTPHLSVGQIRGSDKIGHVQEDLQASWKPLAFRAEKISLIWRNERPDDIFRVGCLIELGP
ncbi:MAG: 2'-5' RNA ligase family protein [Phycisphaerales bacterium]|nr:MAG: 2'-5' RNA ligase family protein [Phycisphaerales bacterium]